jgi:hypothetical protein
MSRATSPHHVVCRSRPVHSDYQPSNRLFRLRLYAAPRLLHPPADTTFSRTTVYAYTYIQIPTPSPLGARCPEEEVPPPLEHPHLKASPPSSSPSWRRRPGGLHRHLISPAAARILSDFLPSGLDPRVSSVDNSHSPTCPERTAANPAYLRRYTWHGRLRETCTCLFARGVGESRGA